MAGQPGLPGRAIQPNPSQIIRLRQTGIRRNLKRTALGNWSVSKGARTFSNNNSHVWRTLLNAFQMSSHLILTIALESRFYDYSHLIDESTGVWVG